MGTRVDIGKRESDLKNAGVALRIARTALLLRDRQIMDSLSMGDLLNQSVVNSIWVSFHVSLTTVKLSFIFDLD